MNPVSAKPLFYSREVASPKKSFYIQGCLSPSGFYLIPAQRVGDYGDHPLVDIEVVRLTHRRVLRELITKALKEFL